MRILLVDDEIRLLDGLRRSLRLERPAWQVVTVGGGTEAFALLQQEAYDVLVTDMLMPGMDGATLLRETRRIAPGTVRIILSGHAGRQLIQSCEGAFHQLLAKPVDPDRFIALLDSFVHGSEHPETSRARQLVAGLERIPSLPQLHEELAGLLNGEGSSLEEVVRIIRLDLGMATKVLKLVNSSYLKLDRPVTDLRQAVELLNLDLLKSAVLRHGALEAAQTLRPSGLDLAELWEHSALVATVAEAVAASEDQAPDLVSACYTAGLLHDLGMTVLAVAAGSPYRQILDQSRQMKVPLPTVEQAAYGTTHAEVGAELLHLWGLEDRVCDLVRSHHAGPRHPVEPSAATILRFADAWCAPLTTRNLFPHGFLDEPGPAHPRLERWSDVASQSVHECSSPATQ